ncbi:SurA N-terminal domain-containing protein [Clostridium vincentii]|uniref:peptidylprolyl isomerase n=1 Tax=Clostridium vincentii TaxID=52704 RepID=A0A2T0BHJ9_9CLOT|nr:SurA N-terminal domain-containing protein [Clostridium vincentii]PRR83323.1 Foldase protein PrsA 3 precursor [Clostridium vincentii]
MKRIKTYIAMAVTGLMILSFAGCNLIERTEESVQNTVYAKVGSTKITKGDVDKALKQYLDQYETQYGEDFETNSAVTDQLKELRQQQVDGLVDNEVIYQSAAELEVTPTDEEIQTQVDERITYYKEALETDEAYKTWLEGNGYDETSIIEFLKKQVVISMTVDKMLEGVEVTDEDIQSDYDSKKDTTYTAAAGADVTHLLFTPETDAEGTVVEGADEAALARAQEARTKVLAGATISDLATSDEYKDHSQYEDLGRVSFEGVSESGSSMVQEFTDGFKSLPAGQISEPVKTSFGYHLILVSTIYPDSAVTPLDDTLKETIKAELLQTKQEEAYTTKLEELKTNIKVKLYEDRI